ncbi:hypothetical protein HRQ65_10830 [Tatlockia micdadei]|uniref:hypothetical protein n=1 Tax=Legionella micdadei TaxID=451 RepID=UPI00156E0E48|nr:hypothetical protein [Legionella micdadei]NSL18879.1 hypothetical protein [Legionella micdadei]
MKKILTLAPVMPQESDIEDIAKTLSFLNCEFQIDFVDPLSVADNLPNEGYYRLWQNELEKQLVNYDAFFGFSFGGVILQQCFVLFEQVKKPIVLFSTPTFADDQLQEKLGKVIRLCKGNRVVEALEGLYDHVFFPNKAPQIDYQRYNLEIASKRLIFGLQRVLETDSTEILNNSTVDHLHLIGELSNLVNRNNVITPKVGRLVIVPEASMRVLQDNQDYCKSLILEQLSRGA